MLQQVIVLTGSETFLSETKPRTLMAASHSAERTKQFFQCKNFPRFLVTSQPRF